MGFLVCGLHLIGAIFFSSVFIFLSCVTIFFMCVFSVTSLLLFSFYFVPFSLRKAMGTRTCHCTREFVVLGWEKHVKSHVIGSFAFGYAPSSY